MELHNLSGQSFPVSFPHSKKCSLSFRWNFLCFGLCSLLLVQSLGTSGKSLTLSSLVLLTKDLHTLESFWVFFPLFHLGLNSRNSLSHSSCDVLPSLSVFMAPCCTGSSMSFLYQGAWKQIYHPDMAESKDHHFQSAGDVFPVQPRMALAFFAASVCCWLTFSLVLTRNSQLLLCRASFQLLSSWLAPRNYSPCARLCMPLC